MRFATLAGLFFSALAVSAQTSQTDATTSELLGELAQLPKCAVRTRTAKTFVQGMKLTTITDHMCGIITLSLELYLW